MTTQPIDSAITAIAAVTASVSGVEASPAFAVFNVRGNVIALHYLANGTLEIMTTSSLMGLVNIHCDVLVPFVDGVNSGLQETLQIAQAVWLAWMSELVQGTFFNNAINTAARANIEFVPNYPYGNVQHIGYRVILEEVKLIYDLA